MSVKENIGAKFGVYKSGDLFLTRRSRRLRRTGDLKGLTLGRFYIIAPENACSGEVNVNEWKEVWQYGSDEVELKDKPWLQDGVAPQCPIRGLTETNRAYIEDQINVSQGFLESHLIKYYGWIFKIPTKAKGYVTPRK